VHTADWWLGELEDPYFKALANAVKEEWNMEPLRIREGGVSSLCFPTYSMKDIVSVVNSFRAVAREGVQVPCVASTYGPELRKLI